MNKAMKLSMFGLAMLAIGSANAALKFVASAVAFVDISGTGTSVGAIGDDSNLTITGAAAGWGGNDLLAGGMSIRVGNNGGIIYGTSATDAFSTCDTVGYVTPSPSGSSPNPFATMAASNLSTTGNGNGLRQFLGVLWDDNTPGAGGNCKYQLVGSDLVIQWTNEDHFNASGAGVITYEVILRGGVTLASGNSMVDYVYQDTLYAVNQYQDDGGAGEICYKNWGNANGNDCEWGVGGGTNTLSDPAFGDASMKPKVAGWIASNDATGLLPHSVSIVPEPTTLLAIGVGLAALAARRRRK